MGKVVDITEKVSFENPKLVIKGDEYEIHADAENMVKIMGLVSGGNDVESMISAGKLLFGDFNFQRLYTGLSFNSFATVIQTAMELASGNDDAPAGEVMAHTTI